MSPPHQKQSNWTMFIHKLTYNTFLVISSSNLSQVTVVVSFHFQIENFAFCLRSIRDQELFQQRLKRKQRTQCFEHMLNQQFNYISIYFKVKTASLLIFFTSYITLSARECVLDSNSRYKRNAASCALMGRRRLCQFRWVLKDQRMAF